MKYLYIFILVISLVGAYYIVAGPPNQISETPAMPEADQLPVEESQGTVEVGEEVSEMTESEEEPVVSGGADISMEFPIPDQPVNLETKTFEVTGYNFGYDVKEIRVKEGDTVTVNFSVSDGFHDWVVDEFKAATEKIREGGLATVTFVADKKGAFEYYCSVGQHRANGMVGKLIVE